MNEQQKISPTAKQIAELVESLAGGNQSKFARMVGCAQPVISRILSGKQEPGRDLLERISKLEGVDRDLLIASRKVGKLTQSNRYLVPIASCLLDGHPLLNQDLLTSQSVEVSPVVFRETMYAVHAEQCRPASDSKTEFMRPDDLIFIDSSIEPIRKNIWILDGKLAVIVSRGPLNNAITMQRVRVKFDEGLCEHTLLVDRNVSGEKAQDRRRERLINLENDHTQPEVTEFAIELKDVVGVALELARSL